MSSSRISLTKKQLETAVGIDLLALCQRFTSDGRITPDEVLEFSEWLRESRDVEMPSLGYLRAKVEQILADGQVTGEELAELHQAIEKVLPPEFRAVSTALRKDEAAKQKPIARLDSMVAGLTYEGRAYVVHKHVKQGDRVFLVRDRENRYSKFAVEVRLQNGMQVGFLPEEEAQRLAPIMDAGAKYRANVKSIWPGRKVNVPIIWAQFFSRDRPSRPIEPRRRPSEGFDT